MNHRYGRREVTMAEDRMPENKQKSSVYEIEDVSSILDAFEIFYWLGDERNLSEVCKGTHVAKRTLLLWRDRLAWDERVTRWDRQILKKAMANGRLPGNAVIQREFLATVRVLDEFFEARKEVQRRAKDNGLPVPPFVRNISELEKLIHLSLLLGDALEGKHY
jgi:hypothetical protein